MRLTGFAMKCNGRWVRHTLSSTRRGSWEQCIWPQGMAHRPWQEAARELRKHGYRCVGVVAHERGKK